MTMTIQSSTQVETLRANVFVASSGNAILSFEERIGREISMHIPPSVARATADAFNAAMSAHEAEGKLTVADFMEAAQ